MWGFKSFLYCNDSVLPDLILKNGWFYNPDILLVTVTVSWITQLVVHQVTRNLYRKFSFFWSIYIKINDCPFLWKYSHFSFIALPPTITERPEPVTSAVMSSLVTLRCRVFGAPNPVIRWLKESQEVKGERFQVKKTSTLSLARLKDIHCEPNKLLLYFKPLALAD